MSGYDALVFNTRRENVPDFGDWALAKDQQEGMREFINSGKGFVCLHISTCLSKTWPEYHDITGGGWISGTSFHPPYGEYMVNIKDSSHPGVQGISDFSTNDELYMGLALKDGNNVFITGDAEDGTHPWGARSAASVHAWWHFPVGLDPSLRSGQRIRVAAGA